MEQQRTTEFEAYVQAFMARHNVPGLALALARAEELVYARAFGYRDLDRQTLAGADTIFGIASITKSFTAMAIGKLVEQGKLSFDDPVVKHLPAFRLPGGSGAAVTIRHLLTHTSGMPPLDALKLTFQAHSSPDPAQPQPQPLDSVPINNYPQLIDYIASFPGRPLGAPGEYFNYSNECFALLGAVVRQVSGIPYAAFVRQQFLEPLAMSRTTFSFEEMYEYDEVSVLYTRQPDNRLQASTRWPCAPAFQAAGRLKSTVTDLIRPFQMYAQHGRFGGRQLLAEEIVQETIAPRYRCSLHESYGHALHIHPNYHGVTLISHGGAGKGISSQAGFVPERQLSAVVLTNLGGVPAAELWGALINLGLGLPLATPRAEYCTSEWPSGVPAELAGRYASAEGNEYVLAASGDRLWLTDKQGTREVKRVTSEVGLSEHSGQPQELRFYRDGENGAVRGLGIGVRFIPRLD